MARGSLDVLLAIEHGVALLNRLEHVEVVESVSERDGARAVDAVVLTDDADAARLAGSPVHDLAEGVVRPDDVEVGEALVHGLLGSGYRGRLAHEEKLVDAPLVEGTPEVTPSLALCADEVFLPLDAGILIVIDEPGVKAVGADGDGGKVMREVVLDRHRLVEGDGLAQELMVMLVEHVGPAEADERPGETKGFLDGIEPFGASRRNHAEGDTRPRDALDDGSALGNRMVLAIHERAVDVGEDDAHPPCCDVRHDSLPSENLGHPPRRRQREMWGETRGPSPHR